MILIFYKVNKMNQHGFHPQLLVRARKSTDLNRSNNIFEQQYGDEGN